MAQGEDMIGESASVGVMLFDAEIGFMIKQPIKDMGRVPHGGADEFAVEWGVLVRDVSVEGGVWGATEQKTGLSTGC